MRAKSKRNKSKAAGKPRLRWVVWAAAAVAATVCIMLIVVVIAMAIKSPFTQRRVELGLEDAVRGKVTFGKFHMVYFPNPGCVAEDVTFAESSNTGEGAPLITIQKLEIEARYADLIVRPGYLARVVLTGLHVHAPLRGISANSSASQSSTRPEVRIGEIVADGGELEVARSDGKAPLKFEMHSLSVQSYARGNSWSYSVTMENAEPPGEIISEGKFGPLNLTDLGATPVSGSYKFQKADLGVFPGISGTLFSTGDFAGRLGEIGAHGTIDIPNFKVLKSEHEVHLTSKFTANVNGTNGDVFLKQVETSFLQTSLAASGSVAGKPGQKGKTTSLDVEVNNGRIQDLLRLFVTASHPPMNGVTSLKAHLEIPPQKRAFLQELILRGDFGIGEGAFTKPAMQTRVDEMSERARGEKQDKDKTKAKPDADADTPENVVLNLKGHVELRDGVAKFSELSFSVPGASARMDGTYNLSNEQIDFHGMLKTEAELSQETTGMKSTLLKPLDPLFKRKKAGAAVAVKMTGTYKNPQFGFDAAGEIKPK
jgi:AsmA-like C-terminal region